MMEDTRAVEAVLGGDREAYGHVMRRYHRRLFYYVLGKVADDGEAEDIVQRTFVTAFHRLKDYNPAQPLMAWLRGIAVNHCRNDFKTAVRQARLKNRLLDARRMEFQESWLDEPEEACEKRLLALRTCVKGLSDEERKAVELRFVEEQPFSSIGEAIARNGEAARLFLFRLRQRLADCVRKRLALGEGA